MTFTEEDEVADAVADAVAAAREAVAKINGANAEVVVVDEVGEDTSDEAMSPEYKALMEKAKASGVELKRVEPKAEPTEGDAEARDDASDAAASAAMIRGIAAGHGAATVPKAEPADYGPSMEDAARFLLGGLAAILDTMASMSPKQRSRLPSTFLRLEENLKIAWEEYHHTDSDAGSTETDDAMPEELSEFLTEAEAEAVAARAAAMSAPAAVSSRSSYDDDDDDDDDDGESDEEKVTRKETSDFFDEPMFEE